MNILSEKLDPFAFARSRMYVKYWINLEPIKKNGGQ